MRFDLAKGFPLLTTKKVFTRGIFIELLWFLSGSSNIKYLVDNDVHIWNDWPYQAYLEKNGLAEKFPKYSDEWKAEMKNYIEKIQIDYKIDPLTVVAQGAAIFAASQLMPQPAKTRMER